MPLQLLEAVIERPAHFAPVIRERLMRLPPTVEEYVLDNERAEHRYSISGTRETRLMGSESSRLLTVVEYLGREHAEPILREYADAVWPLSVEAARRHDAAKAEYNAERAAMGHASVDAMMNNPVLVARGLAMREAEQLSLAISGARYRAVQVAERLDSPMFVDEAVALLSSPDSMLRRWGGGMAAHIMRFADARPDAIAAFRAAAARLRASEDLEDQLAAVGIEMALDPSRKPEHQREYWRLRDAITRQR